MSYSYHPICRHCAGEGTIEVEVASYSGLGGFTMQTQGCPVCKGSGADMTRTITFEDDDPEPDPPTSAGRIVYVNTFNIENHTVQAPGFERDQFLAFVERAKAAQLRTTPSGVPETVLVLSGSSDARYAVTRQTCGCIGHQRVGRCWHRAYAIWLADVAGVDITKVPTIGISKRGLPLTTGRRVAS